MIVLARWLAMPWPYVIGPVLLFKLALAWALPMTGDEAYFVLWGRHLDYGYYDHPPMAGWMMALQLAVSDHRVWLRLPGLLTEFVVAGTFYALMRPLNATRARDLGLLLLLTPLSLINVFTLTDTGVILFAALSFAAAARGLLAASPAAGLAWAAAAGVGLGLAFLSKYFAVLLGLGFVVFYLSLGRRYWRQGGVLVLTAVPFGLLNLHWNWQHCWSNLLFNLVNRHDGEEGSSLLLLLTYTLMMAYVLLPPVCRGLWALRQHREPVPALWQPVFQLATTLAITATVGFALISLGKTIGLHWVLWFQPLILLALWRLPQSMAAPLLPRVAVWGLGHVVVLAVVLALPLSAWEFRPKLQRDVLAAYEGAEILEKAQRYVSAQSGSTAPIRVAAQGYTAASVLAYLTGHPVAVMGPGSRYARQDDFLTDWNEAAGQSVLLVLKKPSEAARAASWFERAQLLTVTHRGVTYPVLWGQRFRAAYYDDTVTQPARARYYAVPDWLPAGACPVTERSR